MQMEGVGETWAEAETVSMQPVAVVTTSVTGKVPVSSAIYEAVSPLSPFPLTDHSKAVMGPPWLASVVDVPASSVKGLPKQAVAVVKFACGNEAKTRVRLSDRRCSHWTRRLRVQK